MSVKVVVLEEEEEMEDGNIFNKRPWREQRRRALSAFSPSLSLSLSLTLSLSLCVSMCVGVCASRLSRLRCCSPPPQMSWEEEGQRMYLAKGKREEFKPACKTNQRL